MSLREWPGFRALGVVFVWVALVFVVFAWRSYWRLSQTVADQGVAAASFDLKLPLILAFGPPMLLAAGYAWFRRRSERRRAGR